MDLLMGLDVGTTATKALLFDLAGNVVASSTYSYGLITPQEGWVEQDPEELWHAVVATSQSVSQHVGPGDRIVALSQSSQAGTTIPVAADGTPICNAISWMDQRAEAQARRVEEQWGSDFIYRTTGWHLYGGLPLQHIGWFRENCPHKFATARRFLFVNDFIIHRLTGQLYMNPSDAGITQLMNVTTGDWDDRMLDLAGIARDQVSPMRPSGCAVGTVTADASEATGLPQDIMVVNGAHDQYCAAVGTGVTQPGLVQLSCGTAWVILAVPESLEDGLSSELSISCHAFEGRWGAIRSLGGVGASLEWFLDRVWSIGETVRERSALYKHVNEGVSRSPAGANGLVFCPLSGGHVSTAGRGGWVGLSLSHSRDDMARAVMEGITFELRWAMEEMQAKGIPVTEFRMVGGAAESEVWPQIVADVTGVSVALPAVRQAASRGAAILAGVGAGIFDGPEIGFAAFQGDETLVKPLPENRDPYATLFHRYQQCWKAVAQAPAPQSEDKGEPNEV